MLVLSRHQDETVHLVYKGVLLGTFHLVAIRGDKVRLGFDFTDDCQLYRSEISPFRPSAKPGDALSFVSNNYTFNKETPCPVHPTNPAETATSSSQEALAPPIEDFAKSITDPK